jgi:DNA invertase Pin-like site-specific DNA recombinase
LLKAYARRRRERTRAGLEAARARGRKGGRKKKFNDKQRALAAELYQGKQHTIAEIYLSDGRRHVAGGAL